MAEETVDQFLARRERELIAQISALRGQLAPKEAELAHVQHMRSFLPGGPNAPSAASFDATNSVSVGPLRIGLLPDPAVAEKTGSIVDILYGTKTIKELTIQALLDHFPNGGSAAAIRDFIRDAYNRVVEPASMRAQMHRLKADDILGHEPSTDTWNFRDGKRALYARYDHPTSRKAMKELQDDSSDDDNALLEAATKLAWRGDNGDS
jgi:hypothetical protein